MKIGIATRDDDRITTIRDYTNIKDKGQISHFIAELKLIETDLLKLWEEWNTKDLELKGGEE